ncbi:MAG TPA: hypothetical protein PLE74_08510 [Candidatus Cloacimonadota bacterium]|nr:hypothetical protein [Candidatus Cloacimonadota bacterium]HPT72310.1 hypothetical protein [Candidatus Cloacimonadota bacterium]
MNSISYTWNDPSCLKNISIYIPCLTNPFRVPFQSLEIGKRLVWDWNPIGKGLEYLWEQP